MFKKYFVEAESWKVFAISVGFFISGLLAKYSIGLCTFVTFTSSSAILITSLGIGSWIYFVGISLYSKLPSSVKLSYRLFVINIVFIILYLVLQVLRYSVFINHDPAIDINPLDLIILPLYFYFIYALVYIIYFVSKALVSIEKNSEATFGKYVGLIFLIVLFPIGIWYIQPRVRAIFSKTIIAG